MFGKYPYQLALAALFFCSTAAAQTSSYGELQSAYIYNFAKYIKWPGEAKVFTIGVMDHAAITDELVRTLKDKKVQGRDIVIKEIGITDMLPAECQIVYLPTTASRYIVSLKREAADKNILIVTEDDLVRKGATISFIVGDDRLQFKLNQAALKEAGLVASEGLLRLAVLF